VTITSSRGVVEELHPEKNKKELRRIGRANLGLNPPPP